MRSQDRRLLILTSITKFAAAILIAAFVTAGPTIDSTNTPVSDGIFSQVGFVPAAGANSLHANLAVANLGFSVNAGNPNQISSNDDWSGVASVEGYFGQRLTATHGVDPQTVVGTEFASHTLPSAPTQVNANKGNPSAYNAGGVTEFDSGAFLGIGFQGNVQANPYVVFYLNSTGRANVTV